MLLLDLHDGPTASAHRAARAWLISPLTVLIFSAACANSPDARLPESRDGMVLELGDWSPPQGQRCGPTRVKAPVPLSAFLDSAAAVTGAEALGAEGALLLSMATDSVGRPSRLRVIDSTLPEPVADSLRALLEDAFTGGSEARDLRRRLLVELSGADPIFRLGSSQMCPPNMVNRSQISGFLEAAAKGSGAHYGTATIWMSVDERGTVQKVQLKQSSGDGLVDYIIMGIAGNARFNPGLLDRAPVPMWVSLAFMVHRP